MKRDAKVEYKQYHDLLSEELKPFKQWVVNDPETAPHYELFRQWFKAFRDAGNDIGIPIKNGRGSVLLLNRDWLFLKKAFLTKKNKIWKHEGVYAFKKRKK